MANTPSFMVVQNGPVEEKVLDRVTYGEDRIYLAEQARKMIR